MSKMRSLARAPVVIDKVIQHCFSIYFHNAFCVQELSRFCLAQVGCGKTLFCAFYFHCITEPTEPKEGHKMRLQERAADAMTAFKVFVPTSLCFFPHVGLSAGVSCYDASIK